ncbi:MAG: glutaredoxin family protein, partial [Candidatus Thermoplasmatota archaeon]|nr:glutaredoxin family protein [Candidatus Thermoplasmatota archaeon]
MRRSVYDMNCMKNVPGKNCGHHVAIYTLSTCGWCKKLKRLLKALDIEYEYVDVDLLPKSEKEKIMKEAGKHNPRESFPTLVVDHGKEVIVGFKKDRIREVLL